MRIERLELRRLPGIDEPFRLADCGPGLNVVLGRNEAGKSSVCRAVRALLWKEEPFRGEVAGELAGRGGRWRVARDAGRAPEWETLAGGAPPALPEGRLRECFSIAIEDALGEVGLDGGSQVAAEIRRELQAGYDLRAVLASERGVRPTDPSIRNARAACDEAAARRRVVQNEQAELAGRERELAQLRARKEEAERARGQAERLRLALELAREREELSDDVLPELAGFPDGMGALAGDERSRLDALGEKQTAERAELERAGERAAEARATIERAIWPGDEDAQRALGELREREAALGRLDAELRSAEQRALEAAAAREDARRALFADPAGADRLGREDLERIERLLDRRAAASTRTSGRDKGAWPAILAAALLAGGLGFLPWGALASLLGAVVLVWWLFARRAGNGAGGEDAPLARERLELLARCGLRPDAGDLTLARIAAALVRADEEEAKWARALAVSEKLETERAGLLERIGALLERFGEGAVDDLDRARAARERLQGVHLVLDKARHALKSAEIERAGIDRRLAEHARERTQLLARAGLESGQETLLDERLGLLQRWRELDRRRAELEGDVARHTTRLADDELAALDASEARRRLEAAEEQARTWPGLVEEIKGLEAEVDAARRGSRLEEALHLEEDAREVLGAQCERLLFSVAAELVLEEVERSHRSESRPDILRRADDWFGRFTHQRYELAPEPSSAGGAGELGFRVRGDRGAKPIAALSSGTRAQLLLALRLAVALQVERGEELPLFLDEALTNSDPERLGAIARSLGELVRDGRQVFFLTSDPVDAARLRAAAAGLGIADVVAFDLDLLRGRAAAVCDPAELEVAPPPALPAPDGGAPQEYALRLGVPALDPFGPVDAAHLWYACHDRPDALHGMLRELGSARVTIGDVRRRLRRGLGRSWPEEERERFELRARVLAAGLEHWRTGRAPPLRADDVRAALRGGKFEEAVLELAAENEWDGLRLVAALRARADERLKGIWDTTIDKLQAHLQSADLWVPEEPLSPEEWREAVLVACLGPIEAGRVTTEEVDELARALLGWLERGLVRESGRGHGPAGSGGSLAALE